MKPLSLHIVRTTLLNKGTKGKKSHFAFSTEGKRTDLLSVLLPFTTQQRREEEEVERKNIQYEEARSQRLKD